MENNEKTTTVRYVSRYLNLTIVRKASYTKEVDGRVVHIPGESIRFQEGTYETSDPSVVEFLDKRPEFGDIFIKVPSNIESLAHRGAMIESLEEREARIKAKEDELKAKELKLNATEEGGDIEKVDPVSLDGLTKKELLEIAEKENVKGVKDKKVDDIKKAIKESREKINDEPAY